MGLHNGPLRAPVAATVLVMVAAIVRRQMSLFGGRPLIAAGHQSTGPVKRCPLMFIRVGHWCNCPRETDANDWVMVSAICEPVNCETNTGYWLGRRAIADSGRTMHIDTNIAGRITIICSV